MKVYAKVKPMRDAGLEAKWSKRSDGRPVMLVRDPNANKRHQREQWWAFDRNMQTMMTEHGIKEGFNNSTLLGDMFSITI